MAKNSGTLRNSRSQSGAVGGVKMPLMSGMANLPTVGERLLSF